MRFPLATACAIIALSAPAMAQTSDSDGSSNFGLGQIIVRGTVERAAEIDDSSIGQKAMERFNRTSLDEAASLIPGVTASNTGGSRNERLIYVRGFDRFQVPVAIDGIRVYLPYDNRLDYGRFLTADLSQIQVAKGYASVLDGPGAMGGAINLVTRKPTKEIEAEVRGVVELDRDGGYAGYTGMGLLGTRQDQWYAQASFARSYQDHWDLAGGFEPTATQASGERDFTRNEDWRVNVKAGFTPNTTDEYSISYTRQEGSKNAPFHVTSPQAQSWTWPYWNLDSIYFLSTTALGDAVTLKTRLYRNTFDNLLRGFDDRNQNSQTLTAGRVFNSWYEEESYGGSAQLDYEMGANRVGLAFHYRRDEHIEYSQVFPTGYIEPPQKSVEDTFSIALEDTLTLSPTLSATAGVSYDWRDLKQADEFALNGTRNGGTPISYPLVDADAWNAQGRLDWQVNADTQAHASISSRTRFPTLAERFSSRFGGATSNPDLKAERATHFEVGGSTKAGPAKVSGAVFYARVTDAIFAFPFVYEGTDVTQSRNVGDGNYYGAELAFDAELGQTLSAGANYTFTQRDLDDPSTPAFEPTGVPKHKGFVYAEWRPIEALHIMPSIEVASDRWTVTTSGSNYYRTGAYVDGSLRIDYDIRDNIVIGAGVRNAFDDNYMLTDGFPEAGRRYFVSLKLAN